MILTKGALLAFLASLLGSCTSSDTGVRQWVVTVNDSAALPVMEQIALNASRCWFKSEEVDFKPYRLAPELKSFSDRPRILLVPRADPTDRPLLVVEASGRPTRLSAYGSLLVSKAARRITRDLDRWAKGSRQC